jgi:hypothetical protein
MSEEKRLNQTRNVSWNIMAFATFEVSTALMGDSGILGSCTEYQGF